ncbi:Aryl hydrocarbon receptor [Acropora cervicornis]|uniref:Aryl hydrocarbon receptor n=1 Tax=Acropora cervicornis TaxID=6130 RepID=A0AAD9QFS7_ACRCE|nr:Aryl hydrocarbon receptor [Acropora cervicornis]
MSTQKRKKRSSSLKGTLNPSKRHRDRFNIELDNLAKLLPFPHDVIQKLDKLSILRLSASYLRAKNFFKEESQVGKLTDGHAEFEGNGVFSKLLLDALDGFVIVLTRDFEVFYASETVQDYLGLAQASVIHQDFLRFIHVDDHELIRKNLQPFPEEEEQKIRILDDENDGTVSESGSTCSGEEHSEGSDDVETERSFVCRMKCILNTSAGFFKLRDLKMAAASSSVCDPRNDRSGVNIHFVDEDELPLAHFVEHRVSEEEFYSDESGSSDEESDESTSDEDMDEEIVAEAQDWSDEINLREDPFRCSGRLRELTLPDSERREYGLFMICTPLETVSSSMLEIRLKTSLFCTKNRMDLSFMDIDQKGRSLLGYHKRDIALQSSYCMIHFDDITVLQTLHSD